MPLLKVANLTVRYLNQPMQPPALAAFSCEVAAGEAIGVIGHSGAGKTTLALALLNLLGNNAVTSGAVFFRGQDLSKLAPADWQRLRGRDIALIPQASQNAWNPVHTIGHQLVELITAKLGCPTRLAIEHATAALREVGLAETVLAAYPHQLSGGMRQRAAIAAAFVTQPACIVADEPTSSLDAPQQNDVLELLANLKHTLQTAMIVIAHDLAAVARLCDRVYVLNQGLLVETGPTQAVLRCPAHPYTQRLIAGTTHLYAALPAIAKG